MPDMMEDLIRQVNSLQKQIDGFVMPELPLKPIAETVLTGSAASVAFSSLPSNFKHIIAVLQARTDRAAETDATRINFNGDTGSNYDYSTVSGNSSTPSASVTRAAAYALIGQTEGANSRASNFSPSWFIIPGYALTDREKWAIGLTLSYGDVSADTDMTTLLRAGRWRSTAAIATITFTPNTGPNFVSGSRFNLYGLS